MFDELYKEETKMQLMSYWRFIGGYHLAASDYPTALNAHIKVNERGGLFRMGGNIYLYFVSLFLRHSCYKTNRRCRYELNYAVERLPTSTNDHGLYRYYITYHVTGRCRPYIMPPVGEGPT